MPVTNIISTIIDELKHQGIERIENIDEWNKIKSKFNNYILVHDEISERINIYDPISASYTFFKYDWYLIPSNLFPEKIIEIIFLMFSNNFVLIENINCIENCIVIDFIRNDITIQFERVFISEDAYKSPHRITFDLNLHKCNSIPIIFEKKRTLSFLTVLFVLE